MSEQKKQIPAGYWQDAKGALVPEDKVRPIDKTRDALVKELVAKSEALSAQLAAFKQTAFADIAAFVQLSAEQYDANIGGKKGNVTLYSFDECVKDWITNASSELKAIVNGAFDADKQGNISTTRVLGLRRLDITDARWLKAMTAIGEAIQVVGSKAYVRVYKRIGDTDQYQQIPLDLAAVSL